VISACLCNNLSFVDLRLKPSSLFVCGTDIGIIRKYMELMLVLWMFEILVGINAQYNMKVRMLIF